MLVPRREVVALAADTPVPEAVRELVATTHGRAPVYRGDLDDIIGVAHLVDLVEAHGRVADHVRPALALPESVGVLDGLRRLQAERQTLAMVINEYGGTEGIVTVEDLLEVLAVEHRAITRLRLTPSRDDKNPSASNRPLVSDARGSRRRWPSAWPSTSSVAREPGRAAG